MRRLSVAVLLSSLVFCAPALAQTTADPLQEGETSGREEGPGYEIVYTSPTPECVSFGGQYGPSGAQYQYDVGGICGVSSVARLAADDALEASRALREGRTNAGGTDGSVLAAESAPPVRPESIESVAATPRAEEAGTSAGGGATVNPSEYYNELPETGGGSATGLGAGALLLAAGILVRRLL